MTDQRFVQNHPDYNSEIERLDFTKKYMEVVIKASESTEENFRETLREALDGVELTDSSLSYISMLTSSNLLRRTTEELNKLKKFYNKPYFARIDFDRTESKEQEVLYIGKLSLFDKETQQPIIVDWRSPVANLYYDGRLGDVSYHAEGEEYVGNLSLKRQFLINDGELDDIRDIDLTTNDELLQLSLSESASNRLSDIISTIQEEQNDIIRADLNKPIIVQGAAGSGKTTIALHRISYFIYTYAENFIPEQLMILAPNRLFIDYISEVLPELGVENVLQTTFIDYVKACLNKKIKLVHPNKKMKFFLTHTNTEESKKLQWLSTFKGSLSFKQMIQYYLWDILLSLIPKEDLYVGQFRLYRAHRIKKLVVEEYQYLPYYKRLEKIKSMLQHHVKGKKKTIVEKITNFYDTRLDRALFSTKKSEERSAYINKAYDKKVQALDDINKQIRTAVPQYMKQVPKHDVFYYYHQLMTDKELLKKYADKLLTEEQINDLYLHQQTLFASKQYEVEDLAALLFMQGQLFGIDKKLKVKNIVVDEAQDYSYFQLFALKHVLETDMFTIVGDLAQGIHAYRGIQDWDIVKEQIFPRASYKTLQKSYRTTIEVMNAANDILRLLPIPLPKVEPVVRHNKKPVAHVTTEKKEMIMHLYQSILSLYTNNIRTVAVIGKTEEDCKKIDFLLKKYTNASVQLLRENEEINKEDIVVVNAQLSKGLEFDAVYIVSLDEYFEETEIDIKLLYVAMTRPLHRLFFYCKQKEDLLLHHLSNEHYEDDPVTLDTSTEA